MSHNVTQRDGVFTVREPAWHGLGVTLEDYPTMAEAKRLAHPWEPAEVPLYRARRRKTTTWEQVDDYKLIIRDDDSEGLGVVQKTYEPVSNQTLYDIAEAIQGEGEDVKLETGGSLKGGRKVWLLLRLNEPIQIAGDHRGDVIPYYALQNAHDGSAALRGQATVTRIVCDNTSQMADWDASIRGTEFTFVHTKHIHDRIDEAKQALVGWRQAIGGWVDMAEHLVERKVDTVGRRLFLEKFVPLPPTHLVSDRVVTNVETARAAIQSILDSETCAGVAYTAYGLVSAAIEYDNHVRKARSAETRFKRAYLDPSKVKADAVELALSVS